MVSKKTHLDPVDLVQIGSKENTKKQKKSTTEAPPSGHRCLLHPLPPNEEKQVHSKNLSLRNTFGTTSLILLALTPPLSLFLFSFPFPSTRLLLFFLPSFFFFFSCPLSHLYFSLFLSFSLPSFFYHSPFTYLLRSLLSTSCSIFSSFFLFFPFHYSRSSSRCSCLPPSFNIFLHLFHTLVFQTLLCLILRSCIRNFSSVTLKV